jgi:glycosyltransferase involved in cell wall biosynthesis
MLEAMAMSRPIIVGAEGEAQDLVVAAGAGLVIAPENGRALAAAVLQLADDRALGQEFGRRGREWVEIHHDRRHLAHDLLAAIEELSGRSLPQQRCPSERRRATNPGE